MVDLFSVCGTFSLPIAAKSEVRAVELDKEMLSALDKGWLRARGLKRVSLETRDLFRRPLLPDELDRFDAAVIDPPRAGAEKQVANLCKSNIPAIAYVSCNPVTFARDAALLIENGYDLQYVETVDQFRWSYQIELVGAFSKF